MTRILLAILAAYRRWLSPADANLVHRARSTPKTQSQFMDRCGAAAWRRGG
jgi:hypothetical protein